MDEVTTLDEDLATQVLTMHIEGELDAEDMAEIGAELFRLAHRGYRRIVVDLGGVSHIDYRGLKPLAARAELYRRGGGDIKLCRVSAYLYAIFCTVGVHDSFDVHGTAEDASAAFKAECLQSVA
ncbi:MAG TPA: STAS domain-containing protein [Myxococcales bacterium]|nr:STAS domain-containing protein [Myxococcales bacterium]